MNTTDNEYHEVIGAVHLHSDFSDGSRPIPEIAEIAGEKNLDFIMFCDHNTLEPKRLGLEGWYKNVLVLIGYEINDPDDRNHYLAFRLNEEVGEGLAAKEYVRLVRQKGGFGVIAHPAEKRQFSDAYPAYPWTAWDAEEFDGIEIWNQLSEWLEGITRRNVAYRMIHPLRSIRYPVWETLERWDRLNQDRRIVGIGGIDVHAFPIKLLGLLPMTIYPYKVQFRSIRTHILTAKPLREGEKCLPFAEAEQHLFDALEAGRCFVTNFRSGDAKGFRFWAESGGRIHPMGSRPKQSQNMVFHAAAPLAGMIHLLKDGKPLKKLHGRVLMFRSDEAGVYRIEVFRKGRGWIYSNPIVVGE